MWSIAYNTFVVDICGQGSVLKHIEKSSEIILWMRMDLEIVINLSLGALSFRRWSRFIGAVHAKSVTVIQGFMNLSIEVQINQNVIYNGWKLKTKDHGEDYTIFYSKERNNMVTWLYRQPTTINFCLIDRHRIFVIRYILRNMPVSIYLVYVCETFLFCFSP